MPRRKQAKRGQSAHPGVVIVQRTHRSGNTTYRAKWKDPSTGRFVEQSLPALDIRNAAARHDWAVRKSRELATEMAALSAHGDRSSRLPDSIDAAVAEYLVRAEGRLRPKTLRTYRSALREFSDYLATLRIRKLTEISRADLRLFRDAVASRQRQVVKKEGARGERAADHRRRSPAAVNSVIRSVKAFLNDAEDLGRVPQLRMEVIRRGLKSLPEAHKRPRILTPGELNQLLVAALRHDMATYKMTRQEHRAGCIPGDTLRYRSVAPLVLGALLTGCRAQELFELEWRRVILTAEHGAEIRIEMSKTHRERAVDLGVCPSLVRLLKMMRLRQAGDAFVFGGQAPLSRELAESNRKRLISMFGAPDFNWQKLRQTTASYLVNAPGIFGSASTYREAAQLGHSVEVAEKNYLNVVKNIPREATTLEAAMGIVEVVEELLQSVGGLPSATDDRRGTAG